MRDRRVGTGAEEGFYARVPQLVQVAVEDRGGAFVPGAGDEGGGEEGGRVEAVAVSEDGGDRLGGEGDGKAGGFGGICFRDSLVTYRW